MPVELFVTGTVSVFSVKIPAVPVAEFFFCPRYVKSPRAKHDITTKLWSGVAYSSHSSVVETVAKEVEEHNAGWQRKYAETEIRVLWYRQIMPTAVTSRV